MLANALLSERPPVFQDESQSIENTASIYFCLTHSPPPSVIRMWFELFIHCRSQWLHRAVILWKCHRYGSLHSLQAPHGRLSDPTDPCGELWAFRSSVDPPRHPHSASLCRPQHWRLEDPAQEPGSAGAMGGEWVSVGDTWCPCPSLVCVGRSLFLK